MSRPPQLQITRRAFMRGAAGAVAVAALPFGLKPDDLRPVQRAAPRHRWALEPGDQLIVGATAPADREITLEAFGVLGDLVDSQPIFVGQVPKGMTLHVIFDGRAGVEIHAPGATQIRAVIIGLDLELRHDDDEAVGDEDPWEDFDAEND